MDILEIGSLKKLVPEKLGFQINLTYILLYNDQITVISYRRKHLINDRKFVLTNKAKFISTCH
jgi:hypothetical protein